jgi:putative peptide zinc metalloprotease protein
MRTAISILLALVLVLGGLMSSPGVGAQTSDATPTPGEQPSVSPVPALPSPSPTVLPVTEPPGAVPPQPEEDAAPELEAADAVAISDDSISPHGSGGRNVASVRNLQDGDLRVRGRIKLVHATGPNVQPVNGAFAYSSCVDCQTFAVALEIVLVSPDAAVIAPQNVALALNYQCTGCLTVARAIQYVYTVDDPHQVPDNVKALLKEMEQELKAIEKDQNVGAAEANARINAVIAQFQDLAESLVDQQDEATIPTSPGAAPPPPAS